MSYGNVYIKADLDNGKSLVQVARRVQYHYSDITFERAVEIVAQIMHEGIDANVDWSKKRVLDTRGEL